jgi:hypothetical protein
MQRTAGLPREMCVNCNQLRSIVGNFRLFIISYTVEKKLGSKEAFAFEDLLNLFIFPGLDQVLGVSRMLSG